MEEEANGLGNLLKQRKCSSFLESEEKPYERGLRKVFPFGKWEVVGFGHDWLCLFLGSITQD